MQKFGLLITALWLVGCADSEVKTPDENTQMPSVNSTPLDTADSTVDAPMTQPLTIGDQEFFVEIADTREERELGLMYREFMPANMGMLFVFEEENPRNFWMKNTLIPLDMIWLDAEKNIVDIQAAQPCKVENCPIYSGKAPAQYVLELNPGVLKAAVGTKAEF
jgi:uncharacterized membrane protein (UPF0127 family)